MINSYALKTESGKVFYGCYDTVCDVLSSAIYARDEFNAFCLNDFANKHDRLVDRECSCNNPAPMIATVGYIDNCDSERDSCLGGYCFNGHKVHVCENCKCILDGLSIYKAEEAQGIDRYANE